MSPLYQSHDSGALEQLLLDKYKEKQKALRLAKAAEDFGRIPTEDSVPLPNDEIDAAMASDENVTAGAEALGGKNLYKEIPIDVKLTKRVPRKPEDIEKDQLKWAIANAENPIAQRYMESLTPKEKAQTKYFEAGTPLRESQTETNKQLLPAKLDKMATDIDNVLSLMDEREKKSPYGIKLMQTRAALNLALAGKATEEAALYAGGGKGKKDPFDEMIENEITTEEKNLATTKGTATLGESELAGEGKNEYVVFLRGLQGLRNSGLSVKRISGILDDPTEKFNTLNPYDESLYGERVEKLKEIMRKGDFKPLGANMDGAGINIRTGGSTPEKAKPFLNMAEPDDITRRNDEIKNVLGGYSTIDTTKRGKK